MKVIEVFNVYTTIDEWGRRGQYVATLRNHEDAIVKAKGQGWYGSMGEIELAYAFEDGLDLYLLKQKDPVCFHDVSAQRAAQKAMEVERIMAKLTPDELDILREQLQ